MLVETYNSDPIVNSPLDVEAFATCQVDLHKRCLAELTRRFRRPDQLDSMALLLSSCTSGTPQSGALPLPGALPFDDLARVTRNLEEFLNSMEAEAEPIG